MTLSHNLVRASIVLLLLFGMVACGGGGGGDGGDEPEQVLHPISGLNFSPYKGGQDPNTGSYISEAQIRERLEIIKGYTGCIRTFGTSSGLAAIPRIAKEMGFCVAAGAWLDSNSLTNESEIEELITIGLAGEVDYLIIGSEVLLRGDLTEQELIDYIKYVKSAVPGVPVSTGEVYTSWLDHPDLVDAVDALFVNYYPYWEGIAVDEAVKAIHAYHYSVTLKAMGKDVIVSETGWPTAGDTIGSAVPTADNAASFITNFVSWAEANAVEYYIFEAFDELWKADYEGEQGAHWGLWYSSGEIKPEMIPMFYGERVADNWSDGELIPGGLGDPSIAFTYVPPIGSTENLTGQVLHVLPADHAVVTYIYVGGGWWIKPYASTPLVSIAYDGTFIVDITTGGIDEEATRIHSFLVRKDYSPPILSGALTLPAELWENALADILVYR